VYVHILGSAEEIELPGLKIKAAKLLKDGSPIRFEGEKIVVPEAMHDEIDTVVVVDIES
jgi:hypothetical protein